MPSQRVFLGPRSFPFVSWGPVPIFFLFKILPVEAKGLNDILSSLLGLRNLLSTVRPRPHQNIHIFDAKSLFDQTR